MKARQRELKEDKYKLDLSRLDKKNREKAVKLIDQLNEEDRKKLFLAVNQAQVSKAVSTNAVSSGASAVYVILYETYLKPIVEGNLNEKQSTEKINEMISHINKQYLKAKIKIETEKNKVANRKDN